MSTYIYNKDREKDNDSAENLPDWKFIDIKTKFSYYYDKHLYFGLFTYPKTDFRYFHPLYYLYTTDKATKYEYKIASLPNLIELLWAKFGIKYEGK